MVVVASRAKRLATFFTGLLECMGFAGVVFGWASLVFVLKKEKYFADFCTSMVNSSSSNSTGETDCSAQDERFSQIFTVASFLNNFMTLPNGYIFDRFGTTITRLIGIFLYTVATLLVAFSNAASAWLLFPALSLLSIGGILFILTNMQVGNLFGQRRSTIITLYNGAFDSSSAVFLLVKVLYENGLSIMTMFLCISACSVWHLLRTVFLMPRTHIPYPLPEGYSYGVSCRKSASHSPNEGSAEDRDGVYSTGAKSALYNLNEGSAEAHDGIHSRDADETKDSESDGVQKSELDKAAVASLEPPVASFQSCACSWLFFWHLVWLSVMQLRHYLFIGTLNPMLSHLSNGDNQKISLYTNAFAFTQLCGVFCAPWNGLLMDRHKRGKTRAGSTAASDSLADLRSTVLSLAITAGQCVLFSLCASIPVLPVQYATFIFQVVNRAFLYGGNAAFLTVAFPLAHFGKLYGLVMALSAVVSLLQYPCFALVKDVLDGDPFYVNIGLLVFILLAFIHPINVFLECRHRERACLEATNMPSALQDGEGTHLQEHSTL